MVGEIFDTKSFGKVVVIKKSKLKKDILLLAFLILIVRKMLERIK